MTTIPSGHVLVREFTTGPNGKQIVSERLVTTQGKTPASVLQAKLSRRVCKKLRAMTCKRVPCGATRHHDGLPCESLREPGKKRCRFHGGRSTGPKTPEGKAQAMENLRKGQVTQMLADGVRIQAREQRRLKAEGLRNDGGG